MKIWVLDIWMPFIKKKSADGDVLIIFDISKSHVKEEFLIELKKLNQKYVIIPAGLTRFMQRIDVIINSPVKKSLTKTYV